MSGLDAQEYLGDNFLFLAFCNGRRTDHRDADYSGSNERPKYYLWGVY